MKPIAAVLASALGLGTGCITEAPRPTPTPRPQADTAVVPTPSPAPLPEDQTQELALGVRMPKKTPAGLPILTPMDFALLVLDPTKLTRDRRRKQAYARRKVIMNNPESSAARALNDLTEAHRNGELGAAPGSKGVMFYPRGTPPTGGRPPAGWRPPSSTPSTPEPAATPPAPGVPSAARPNDTSPKSDGAAG